MGLRMQAVIVDCHDPGRLAEFWAAALGWRITGRDEPEWAVEPPEGSREDSVVPDLLFIHVPDPTPGKNRLHLDLRPDRDQAAEIARLEGLGATRADVGQGARRLLAGDARSRGQRVLRAHAVPARAPHPVAGPVRRVRPSTLLSAVSG